MGEEVVSTITIPKIAGSPKRENDGFVRLGGMWFSISTC
jgi:hypothetical protein